MNQIYKYSAIHPLKEAQPGKGKSSSKAGKKNPLKHSVNYFKLSKKVCQFKTFILHDNIV